MNYIKTNKYYFLFKKHEKLMTVSPILSHYIDHNKKSLYYLKKSAKYGCIYSKYLMSKISYNPIKKQNYENDYKNIMRKQNIQIIIE